MLWLPAHGGEAMFIWLASSSSDQQKLNDGPAATRGLLHVR